MVVHACSLSYSEDWGGRTVWVQEVEVAVSRDHTTVSQPGDRARLHLKKKKKLSIKAILNFNFVWTYTVNIENVLRHYIPLCFQKQPNGFCAAQDQNQEEKYLLTMLWSSARASHKFLWYVGLNVSIVRPGMAAHACNPSTLGGWGRITWGREFGINLANMVESCL